MDQAHAPAPHGDAGHSGGHGDAGHGAAGHGNSSHHGGLSYFQVFLILLVVTVAEVAVAYMDISKSIKIVTFVVMALYKAVMVAAYFMHLRFEKPLMWVIAAAPLMLGVIIAIGAYPDSEKGTQRFKDGVLDPWTVQKGEAPHDAAPHDAAPKEEAPAGSHR
jgi:cytochrome c oxidase subunit 4